MKKVISIILVLSICIATFSSVAFAGSDITVQSDVSEASEQNTIVNYDDSESESSQSVDKVDNDEDDELEELVEEYSGDDSEDSGVESPEIAEYSNEEKIESDVEETAENTENETVSTEETEETAEIVEIDSNQSKDIIDTAQDNPDEVTETESDTSIPEENDDEISEIEGLTEENSDEVNGNDIPTENISDDNTEDSQAEADVNGTADEAIAELATESDLESSDTQPLNEDEQATTVTLENEIDKIKDFLNPSDDDFQTEISDIVIGRPEHLSDYRISFFTMDENEVESHQEFIKSLYGSKDILTYSYVFLGEDMPFVGNSERTVTYLHNESLNLQNQEALISLYDALVEDSNYDTEFDIVYTADEDQNLYFKAADGSEIKITKVADFGDDGKRIARIKLSNDLLKDIAYYRDAYFGDMIFKLVGETDCSDITIHEINITSAHYTYAVVRAMNADCFYIDPIVGLTITPTDEDYIGAFYSAEGGDVYVETTENANVNLLDGFDDARIYVSTDLDRTFFDVYIPAESPQTAIENALVQVNPDGTPASTTNPDDKDGDGKDDDDDDETEGGDGTKKATDTDLDVATDTDLETQEAVAYEMEEIPDATPLDSVQAAENANNVATPEEIVVEVVKETSGVEIPEETSQVEIKEETEAGEETQTEETEESEEVSEDKQEEETAAESEDEEETLEETASEEQTEEIQEESEQPGTEPEPEAETSAADETVDSSSAENIPEDATLIEEEVTETAVTEEIPETLYVPDATPIVEDASLIILN